MQNHSFLRTPHGSIRTDRVDAINPDGNVLIGGVWLTTGVSHDQLIEQLKEVTRRLAGATIAGIGALR